MGVSTHVLDTSLGRPGAGVPVKLARWVEGQWITLGEGRTDADGRCKALLAEGAALVAGTYKVHFETALYFEEHQQQGLYPYVEVVFEVRDAGGHYHIPLLLTANGYSTYRGS